MNTIEAQTEASVRRPLISTSDIAALAQVRRPVVSMWKSRSQDTEHPFPAPVLRQNQSDYFDCGEISDWFADTGLGNNADAAADVLTYADIALLSKGQVEVSMVEALLVLRSLVDEPLSNSADVLVSDADDYDPEDHFLFSEVHAFAAHQEHLNGVIALINQIYSQSFSVAHSLGQLAKRARDRDLVTRGESISTELAEFSAQLLLALADLDQPDALPGLHGSPLRFIDLDSSHFDLVDHLLADEDYLGSNPELLHNYPVVVGPEQSAKDRQTLRRLVANNLNPRVLDSFEDLGPTQTASFAFISPTTHADAAAQIIEVRLPDIAQLSPSHVGVVIGPRDLLTGSNTRSAQADGIRSPLIRDGHIRCIALLPEGLFPNHPREQLALWVLASPPDRPDPLDPFYLADLTGVDFIANAQNLLTDCVAAVNHSKTRAFAFLQKQTIKQTVETHGISFPVVKRIPRSTDPSSDRIQLEQALLEAGVHANLPQVNLSNTAVRPTHDPTLPLDVARAKRLLAVIPGNRIEQEWVSYAPASGLGTRVIDKPALVRLAASPHAVASQTSTKVIDPLVLGQLDHVRLTRPGDVVVVQHGGTRAAWCDAEGGNVVAHPLRIIRPRSSRVYGHAIAADINAFQSHTRDWKHWSIRIFPDRQASDATKALKKIETERAKIVENLNALDRAAQAIADAVSRGGVHVKLAE